MATTHKVEIAFATQPDDPSPTWTDVSGFFAAGGGAVGQITRGRSDQVSSVSPSTFSLTLDNHDGRFTAGYTSGAYYPNVVLGKRIRISTSTGAGFTERFDGYVDSWPVQWAPTGKYAEAQITASDRLKRLGRQLAADNLISTYYLASNPTDYWMLADAEGTTVPLNRSGTTALVAGGPFPAFAISVDSSTAITFGAGTGPGHDGLTAVQVINDAFGAPASPTFAFSETASLTVSLFCRCAANMGALASSANNIFFTKDPATGAGILLGTTGARGTGQALISIENTVGATPTVVGTVNVQDGSTHHLGFVMQGLGAGLGANLRLYVDGVLDSLLGISTTDMSTMVAAPIFEVLGSVDSLSIPPTASTYTYAHLAVFHSALTAQNMADFAAAGLTAFSGETALARTTRIGGLAGVTPVVTGTPGTTSMAPLVDINGADYLSLLQTVADTEAGLLFTQTSGEVRLRPRRDMQNQATKWTLTNGQYGTDLTFVLDDFGVVNDAIATRPDGNQQHLTNATSVAANGTYSVSTTLQTTDDNEVLSYAQWEINTSIASPRCSQVTVDLLAQPSLVATYLTLELGDRITLSGLPSTAPASSVDLIVQGWTETIALDSYTVTMNTTPLPLTVWKLGDSTLGVLGSTTRLAY